MRLITDKQHAQIVEALKRVSDVDNDCDILSPNLADAVTDALATLQALPEVEVVGKVNDTTSTDFQVEFNKLIGIDTPLYATKEPS